MMITIIIIIIIIIITLIAIIIITIVIITVINIIFLILLFLKAHLDNATFARNVGRCSIQLYDLIACETMR